MKKILPLLLLCFSVSMFAQKLVFVEEFTQASCPPCEQSTPQLNETLEANAEKVIQLRYQTSFPGVDPMNEDNPVEVRERLNYYGVGGVPTLFMNGSEPTGVVFPTLISEANINGAYGQAPPIEMSVTHSFDADITEMTISVTVTNPTDQMYDMGFDRLRVATVEELISWNTPPGSTSITNFEYVMKEFVTGTTGMEVPALGAGETWTNEWTVALPKVYYNVSELNVVAFIQDDATQDVMGANDSERIELDLPDAAVSSQASSASDDITCEEKLIDITAVITNTGDKEVTSLNVNIAFGDQVTTLPWTGSITPGSAEFVTLDPQAVGNGTNQMVVSISNVNGGADQSSANNVNVSGYYSGYSADAVGEFINEDFEDINGYIGNGIGIDWPIAEGTFGFATFTVENDIVTGFSGYGEGEKCIFINFYQWNPAEATAADDATMTFQNIDLSNSTGSALTFDRAGGRYQTSNDRLQILASTDCGATWDIVHDIAGADLSTVDGHTETLFAPTAEQWETDIVDMTAYDGESAVMIQFKAISDWGNCAYIDNIKIGNQPVSVADLEETTSISLTPNPASEYVNISLGLEKATDVNLTVRDLSGRVVDVVRFGQLTSKQVMTYDVSDLESGMYFFQIDADNKRSTKKVSVF